MGAGSFPAGQGPAGKDPVVRSPEVFVQFPAATFVDLGVRDHLLDSDGNWREMDPVDQAMQLAFLIRRGTLRSAPEIGHTFRDLTRVSPNAATLQEEGRRRAKLAQPAKDMIDAGFAEITLVTVRSPKRGELSAEVTYRNLRARTRTTKTINVNMND
jgi:hypothetical protein